jgi:ABC-type nickel/cobalt efflux system permease component RcnA
VAVTSSKRGGREHARLADRLSGLLQAGIMRGLAAELRAGGLGTVALAFTLGTVHALKPGHGKAALAVYFLGREARIGKGLRVALMASFCTCYRASWCSLCFAS